MSEYPLAALHAAVAKVAPIEGVSSDGEIWFKPEATDEQKAAAQAAFNAFDPNAPAVPEFVTPWQARAALLDAGLLDQVNALVDQQTTAVKMKWEFASEVRRDDPLINSLAGALNLTSEQLDALFIAAANVS